MKLYQLTTVSTSNSTYFEFLINYFAVATVSRGIGWRSMISGIDISLNKKKNNNNCMFINIFFKLLTQYDYPHKYLLLRSFKICLDLDSV